MARIRYYYNTESCQFEKPVWNTRTVLVKGIKHLFVGCLVAGIFGSSLFYWLDNADHQVIRKNISQLKTQAENFEDRIEGLRNEIKHVESMDAEFYASVLKMDVDVSAGPAFGEPAAPSSLSEVGVPRAMSEISTQLSELDAKVKNQTNNLIAIQERFREKGRDMRSIPSMLPVKGPVVSGFGQRKHPLLKIVKKHEGIDFAVEPGSPVYATADGVVSFTGTSENGYGIHIDINHGVGIKTRYAHLSKVTVSDGKKVRRGEIIGYSGKTGLVKGPHVHYEILINGNPIDPVNYFYSDITPDKYVEVKRLAAQENESMD